VTYTKNSGAFILLRDRSTKRQRTRFVYFAWQRAVETLCTEALRGTIQHSTPSMSKDVRAIRTRAFDSSPIRWEQIQNAWTFRPAIRIVL
jgi:hypothetical protein